MQSIDTTQPGEIPPRGIRSDGRQGEHQEGSVAGICDLFTFGCFLQRSDRSRIANAMDAAAMTVLSEIQIGPIMRKNWKIILGSLHCCSETHAQCLGSYLNMECRQSGIVKNYSLSIFEPSSVVGANSLRWMHCCVDSTVSI